MGYFIYNDDYGGYCWSQEAIIEIQKRHGKTPDPEASGYDDKYRTDPIAHQVFDEWGSERCGDRAKLVKVHVPDELINFIVLTEYDGKEFLGVDAAKLYETKMEELLKHVETGTTSKTLDDVMKCRQEIHRLQELAEKYGPYYDNLKYLLVKDV